MKSAYSYKAVLLVVIDNLLFGEKHTISSSAQSINIYLRDGYEIVIFDDSFIELKCTNEDNYTKNLHDGYDLIEIINKYKSL